MTVTSDVRVLQIPTMEIFASPDNARRTINPDQLRELSLTINQVGIQVPLLVRPSEAGLPEENYEIVCGHRRHAAAQQLDLATVPCIVREMSDEEAEEIALIDNLQRVDLPPFEEAQAFGALLDRQGSIEAVATVAGKSASYVGRRLSLLNAITPVQEALKSGLIEIGHALELARLDSLGQQRFLGTLRIGYCAPNPYTDEEEEEDGEDLEEEAPEPAWRRTFVSVADLRREIAHSALRTLDAAPFPLGSAELGDVACVACPKRTGNVALLFDELSANTCTDRGCFDRKIDNFIAMTLEQARESKSKLLKLSNDYTREKDAVQRWDVEILKDGACASAENAIWINGPHPGELAQICRDRYCKTHAARGAGRIVGGQSKAPVKAKADRSKLLARVKVEKAYRLQLFKELMLKPLDPKPTDAMVQELVVFAVGRFDSAKHDVIAEILGWPKAIFGWQQKEKVALARLAELSQADALRVALVGLQASQLTVHEYDVDRKNNSGTTPEIGLERIAKLIGVDAAAIRERVDPASVKVAKAPAKKAAKKTTAKPTPARKLAPEVKKRIVAATKKRRDAKAGKAAAGKGKTP